MSTFAELIQKPSSKKVVIVELDIGNLQDFWANWRAGCWVVNFSLDYDSDPEIADAFLNTLTVHEVINIGSVLSDGVQLTLVSSTAEVQSNEQSFYWDADTKDLYIHLENGDEPSLHSVNVGEVIGIANFAGTHNTQPYESRLVGLPSVSKSRDPLFYGKISFDGGNVTVDNRDGEFDRRGESWDIFGNAARILVGFDELGYADFEKAFTGYIEGVRIGPENMEAQLIDRRKSLSKKIPDAVFDQTTYPNLKDENVGKTIPVGYGVMLDVPAVCTNEEESSPSTYAFKLFDMRYHDAINEITAVYVDGAEVTPDSTDLVNATFELLDADYDPGDTVTVDCKGYEDMTGALIENALDIIKDLLTIYFPIYYTATYFNTSEWETAEALAPDINLFVEKPTEIIELIEEISTSVFGLFIIQDNGLYTYRIYDADREISQFISRDELLEVPVVEYDPTEVLTSTYVGYAKRWNEDDSPYLHDTSQEQDIFERFKVKREETFDTLLTNSTDAQTFSDRVLALSGDVRRIFTIRTKWQTIQREIGDFVRVDVYRRKSAMLGVCKAEVIGIDKNFLDMEVILTCRLIEVYGNRTVTPDQIVAGGAISELWERPITGGGEIMAPSVSAA